MLRHLRPRIAAHTAERSRTLSKLLRSTHGSGGPTLESGYTGQYLGEQARNHGSIHSDTLTEAAANLAERGVVGIYPVSGWWKDQPKRDRSAKGARYALVVSIETSAVNTDIWTPVAQQVGLPIAVAP